MPPKKVREEAIGGTTLRVVFDGKEYHGIAIHSGKMSTPIVDSDPERVWRRLRNDVGKAHPAYFGYDGARSRFISIFPSGFEEPWYLANERQYKLDAQARLLSHLPLERAHDANADDAKEVARVYGRTNLLSQFELARVGEIMRSEAGSEFVRAAATFAVGDHKAGLFTMNRLLVEHGRQSWPAVTYLPFLWRPEANMFLKPQVTKDFAQRVGHAFAFDYSANLDAAVYRSLLELIAETENEIADLGPRDRIDVQSFLWVVGGYTEEDAETARGSSASSTAPDSPRHSSDT